MRRFLYVLLADQEYRLAKRATTLYRVCKSQYTDQLMRQLCDRRRWRVIDFLKRLLRG